MTRIKICCIQNETEIVSAQAAGALAVGLVGPMPSGPGQLDDRQITKLAATAPAGLMTVLLTSRTRPEAVVEHVQTCRPRAVQLVDRVDPGTSDALRRACPGVTIIQVIHVAGAQSVDDAARAGEHADMLLLDSGNPLAPVKTLGGTGNIHDWSLSARIVQASALPVWLAGGLTPDNVADAIRAVRPYGVDVCSGLRPTGALDPSLLAAFAKNVRNAENG